MRLYLTISRWNSPPGEAPRKAMSLKAVPRRKDLRRTDLRRTIPRRTDLRRTDLRRTILRKTDPLRTELRRTDLRRTVPRTTVPLRTVPLRTVPQTTVPQTTVPLTTVPLTTVPMMTVPLRTVTRTTVPLKAEPPQTLLLRAARATIEAASCWSLPHSLELSLLFTDDDGIRALNRAYRNQDKPTDVLSFPLWEEQPPLLAGRAAIPLGDIVISLTRAAAQAQELGHSAPREAVFLFVHGLLHLLGYDHERGAAEERRMFALQKQIMTSLKVEV